MVMGVGEERRKHRACSADSFHVGFVVFVLVIEIFVEFFIMYYLLFEDFLLRLFSESCSYGDNTYTVQCFPR